jgi:flagellar biosynthesis/type III secretory pathway ATPase
VNLATDVVPELPDLAVAALCVKRERGRIGRKEVHLAHKHAVGRSIKFYAVVRERGHTASSESVRHDDAVEVQEVVEMLTEPRVVGRVVDRVGMVITNPATSPSMSTTWQCFANAPSSRRRSTFIGANLSTSASFI